MCFVVLRFEVKWGTERSWIEYVVFREVGVGFGIWSSWGVYDVFRLVAWLRSFIFFFVGVV